MNIAQFKEINVQKFRFVSMSEMIIRNLRGMRIEVTDQGTTLLQNLQNERIDLMHACGGKGRCTTCKLEIEEGYESLSDPSPFEKRCQETGVLKSNERLACQSRLESGGLKVSIPAEYQLPHLNYSDH